jgi:hypothetical protein
MKILLPLRPSLTLLQIMRVKRNELAQCSRSYESQFLIVILSPSNE